MKTIIAVGIALLNEQNKVLIAKRPEHKPLGLKWEFPGGKVEDNETLEECIVREIKEELNLDIIPIYYVGEENFDYDHANVTLHLYTGTITNPSDMILNEHIEARWVSYEELSTFDFPAIDLPFIAKLKQYIG